MPLFKRLLQSIDSENELSQIASQLLSGFDEELRAYFFDLIVERIIDQDVLVYIADSMVDFWAPSYCFDVDKAFNSF